MEYRILRHEHRQDGEGNEEIFLNIEITDGVDVYGRSEWLTPADVALVIADETAIDGVALNMANRAVAQRPAQLAREVHDREVKLETIKLETAKAILEAEQLKAGV